VFARRDSGGISVGRIFQSTVQVALAPYGMVRDNRTAINHMSRDFEPPWEQTNIVFVETATLRRAEHRFLCCEACNPEDAQFAFDNVLDEVTGNDPRVTDYVLAEPAKCPRCKGEVREKTCVEWHPGGGNGDVAPASCCCGGLAFGSGEVEGDDVADKRSSLRTVTQDRASGCVCASLPGTDAPASDYTLNCEEPVIAGVDRPPKVARRGTR